VKLIRLVGILPNLAIKFVLKTCQDFALQAKLLMFIDAINFLQDHERIVPGVSVVAVEPCESTTTSPDSFRITFWSPGPTGATPTPTWCTRQTHR
jgi:hypothetical protein